MEVRQAEKRNVLEKARPPSIIQRIGIESDVKTGKKMGRGIKNFRALFQSDHLGR